MMTDHNLNLPSLEPLAGPPPHNGSAVPDVKPSPMPTPWLTIFSAVLGFLLIAIAFLTPLEDPRMGVYRWPMLSVALAIIMGAAGAQVTARLSWLTAGGAAAMVLIFAKIYQIPPYSDFAYAYLRGSDEFQQVAVQSDEVPFLSARTSDTGFFHFVARAESLKSNYFTIYATNKPQSLPLQVIISCIPTSLLSDSLRHDTTLDLSMTRDEDDPEKQRWSLTRTGSSDVIASSGNHPCGSKKKPLNTANAFRWAVPPIIGSAEAQGSPDVQAIIDGLQSPSLAAQAIAQDQLAKLRDVESIGSVLKSWQTQPANPQVDTGIIVGLVNGIRQNRVTAVPIVNTISREQLDHLVVLTGSRDRTVRYSSTELISWMLQSLAWPSPPNSGSDLLGAVFQPYSDPETYASSSLIRTAGDPGNVFYNVLVALLDAKCDMRSTDREQAAAVLGKFKQIDFIVHGNYAKTLDEANRFASAPCN